MENLVADPEMSCSRRGQAELQTVWMCKDPFLSGYQKHTCAVGMAWEESIVCYSWRRPGHLAGCSQCGQMYCGRVILDL